MRDYAREMTEPHIITRPQRGRGEASEEGLENFSFALRRIQREHPSQDAPCYQNLSPPTCVTPLSSGPYVRQSWSRNTLESGSN